MKKRTLPYINLPLPIFQLPVNGFLVYREGNIPKEGASYSYVLLRLVLMVLAPFLYQGCSMYMYMYNKDWCHHVI